MSRPERQRGHLPQDFGGCVSLFVRFLFVFVSPPPGGEDGTGRAWAWWVGMGMGWGDGKGVEEGKGRWKMGVGEGKGMGFKYVSMIASASSVSDFQLGDCAADFLYDADAFVPESHPGFDVVGVRVTQARVGDSEEDFIWLQRWDVLGYFLDFAVVKAEDGVGPCCHGGGCTG
jgi:hypothetical protein